MLQVFHQICHQNYAICNRMYLVSLVVSRLAVKCASQNRFAFVLTIHNHWDKTQQVPFCLTGFACSVRLVIISYGNKDLAPSLCARCFFYHDLTPTTPLGMKHNYLNHSVTKCFSRPVVGGGGVEASVNLSFQFRCDLASWNCSYKIAFWFAAASNNWKWEN